MRFRLNQHRWFKSRRRWCGFIYLLLSFAPKNIRHLNLESSYAYSYSYYTLIQRRIFAFCEIEPTFFGRKEDSNSMSITLYASAASFGVAELH